MISHNKQMVPGTVVKKHPSPRSYIVETMGGTRLRGNRRHLKATRASFQSAISQYRDRLRIGNLISLFSGQKYQTINRLYCLLRLNRLLRFSCLLRFSQSCSLSQHAREELSLNRQNLMITFVIQCRNMNISFN